jgi:hypothetical protein
MRILWALVLLVILCGCQERDDRAQAAADADAGIVAAIGSLQRLGYDAAQPAIDILVAARKYVAPAAGVPHAEWPAPRMAPFQIEVNPQEYSDAAPPEPQPWGAGIWAGLTTAATVGLWLGKRLLPLVPGIGGPVQSLIGTVADVAWNLTAHSGQKAADKTKDQIAQAAMAAAPVIEILRSLPPDTLPDELARALNSRVVTDGLRVLSSNTNENENHHASST